MAPSTWIVDMVPIRPSRYWVMAAHPGRKWGVPALCPEEVGGVFDKVGLELGPLAQLQMVVE